MANGQSKSILQRLEEVEVQVQGMRAAQAAVQNVQAAGRQTLAILQALIKEVGVLILGEETGAEELDKRIHQNLLNAQQAFVKQRQAEQKKVLARLVEGGQLVSAPSISKESILELTEYQVIKTKEGEQEVETKQVSQEYVQLHISQLDPKLADQFLGQALGFELRDTDFELKVIGIYEPKPVDAEAPAAEAQAPEAPPAPAEETVDVTPRETPDTKDQA